MLHVSLQWKCHQKDTFEVMAIFLSVCLEIFLGPRFCVVFLSFQPKNQFQEQGRFLRPKAAFIPETLRFKTRKKIANKWKLLAIQFIVSHVK